MALLVAWSALAAMFLAQRPTWARAVLLGILLGLGGSAKLSPLGLVAPLAAAGFGLNTYGRGADPFFFADIGGQLKGVWNDRVGFFVRPATFSVWAGPFGGVGLWTLFGGLTLSF